MSLIKKYRYLIVFLAYIFFISIAIAEIFYFTVESNPVKYNNKIENQLFSFVPQGWAFFTRSPREAQIAIYQKDEHDNFTIINQRHAHYSHLFGLIRRPSKLLGELQMIKRQIATDKYIDTTFSYQTLKVIDDQQLINSLPLEVFENRFYKPDLCGEYIIVFQKPVPWAWSKNIRSVKMPCKMIKVKILCANEEN